MNDKQGIGLEQQPVFKGEIVFGFRVLRMKRMSWRLTAPNDLLQLMDVCVQFAALAFMLANMAVRGSG